MIWWILFVSLSTSKFKKKLIKTYIPLCLKYPIHVCLPSFVWCSQVFNIGMTSRLRNRWIYLDACINIPWVLLLIYSSNILNTKVIITSIKHLALLIMLYLVYIPKASCKRKFSHFKINISPNWSFSNIISHKSVLGQLVEIMNPCALILLEFNLLCDRLNINPNELWNRRLVSLEAMKVHIMVFCIGIQFLSIVVFLLNR